MPINGNLQAESGSWVCLLQVVKRVNNQKSID